MSDFTNVSIKDQNKSASSSLLKKNIRKFMRNKLAVFGLVVVVVIVGACVFGAVAGLDFNTPNPLFRKEPPSAAHPFGTDTTGRDLFARVLFGGCYSIFIGVFCAVLSSVVGAVLGAIAGFYGGWVDNVIMRVMDVLMAVPSTLLAISIAAALGSGLFNLMIAAGIGTIPSYARTVRASVLTVKDQEYIEAARAGGASDLRIIIRHILPNCLAPIIVRSTLGVASAILTCASLSYIGLGVQPPTPEWGNMLNTGKAYLLNEWYMALFPGLAIMLVILR